MSGSKDEFKGKINKAVGNFKEKVGEAIGDDDLEGEGILQGIKGEGQKALGVAKDALKVATKQTGEIIKKVGKAIVHLGD